MNDFWASTAKLCSRISNSTFGELVKLIRRDGSEEITWGVLSKEPPELNPMTGAPLKNSPFRLEIDLSRLKQKPALKDKVIIHDRSYEIIEVNENLYGDGSLKLVRTSL